MTFTTPTNMLYYIGNHETRRQYENWRSCKEQIQQQSWDNNLKSQWDYHPFVWLA